MTTGPLLQSGIAMARAGDFEQARAVLTRVVQADPKSDVAWYWLGFCMTAHEKREFCFRRALTLNPDNLEARRELETLTRLRSVTDAEPASPEPPGDSLAPVPADDKMAISSPEPQSAPEAHEPPLPMPTKLSRNALLRIAVAALAGMMCFCVLCSSLLVVFARDQINAALGLGTTIPLLSSLTPTSRQPPTLPPAWTPTPTPPPTQTPSALPTQTAPVFAFATPEGAASVDMTVGTGPVTLEPGESRVFHFRLPEPISFQAVTTLTFHLISATEDGESDVQLYLWDQVADELDVTALDWGANEVEDPAAYVSGAGDIFVEVWNLGEERVTIDNLSFTLVVRNEDGGEETYGLERP